MITTEPGSVGSVAAVGSTEPGFTVIVSSYEIGLRSSDSDAPVSVISFVILVEPESAITVNVNVAYTESLFVRSICPVGETAEYLHLLRFEAEAVAS